MKRRIILLGPPGSGKGTIAAQLQAGFGLPHVSSGHLLRQEVEAGSELGRQAGLFLERGELVPDDLMLAFMRRWMETASVGQGFMFDGFPRTVPQGEALDGWLAALGLAVEATVHFDCPLELALRRMSGRRSCPRCGRVYHLRSNPPRQPDQCDDCGAELTRRGDDAESVMRKRLEVYARQTEPLAGYYRGQGKLVVLNGADEIGTMLAQVTVALGG
jgi:adenylate kinase